MAQVEERRGAATTERIVDAATALFSQKGYHATTMRELAAAVGIKAASLYNHFPGKEDVLHRIAHGTMAELLDGGRAAMAPHETPRERLGALIRFHVVYHAERRFQARIADEQLHALGRERRESVVEVRDAYTDLFRQELEAGRREHGWLGAPLATHGLQDRTLERAQFHRVEPGFVEGRGGRERLQQRL